MLMAVGCRENLILPALYSYAKDGVIMVLLASHVDDILWACDPAAEHVIDDIKKELKFGALDEGSFRFCGVEIIQEKDATIKVTCTATSKKLEPVTTHPSRRGASQDQLATAEEQALCYRRLDVDQQILPSGHCVRHLDAADSRQQAAGERHHQGQ